MASRSMLLRRVAPLVQEIRGLHPLERLSRVSHFFHDQVDYRRDDVYHKRADYWQGPVETLRAAAGDCEDVAIAKIRVLIAAGIPREKLFLDIFRMRKYGRSKDDFHAVVNFDGTYILDWPREIIVRDAYYSSFAKEYYGVIYTTPVRWYPACVLFPAGYYSGVRNCAEADAGFELSQHSWWSGLML